MITTFFLGESNKIFQEEIALIFSRFFIVAYLHSTFIVLDIRTHLQNFVHYINTESYISCGIKIFLYHIKFVFSILPIEILLQMWCKKLELITQEAFRKLKRHQFCVEVLINTFK